LGSIPVDPPAHVPQSSKKALPPATPAQSAGGGKVIPAQLQFVDQTSPVVLESSSSQAVPGSAGPPAAPVQSINWPTHWQFAFHWSLPVAVFASLHGVPGSAGPFATPAQSKTTGIPTQLQLLFHTSPVVFALLSLHGVPINAGPPAVPVQSINWPTH